MVVRVGGEANPAKLSFAHPATTVGFSYSHRRRRADPSACSQLSLPYIIISTNQKTSRLRLDFPTEPPTECVLFCLETEISAIILQPSFSSYLLP